MVRVAVVFLAAVVLAGCGSPDAPPVAARPREVRIQWLGNRAFLISSSLGIDVLTDPFASGTGGRSLPKNLRPDILLISAERPDANNVDAMDNFPTTLRGAVGVGPHTANGIAIRGVPVFRDADQQSDMTLAFAWRMDGIRFGFLGNLDRPLTGEQAGQLGAVDVLFLPVRGRLSDAQAATVISQLHARVVVPMGPGARAWAAAFPRHFLLPGAMVRLTPSQLPTETTAVAFAGL